MNAQKTLHLHIFTRQTKVAYCLLFLAFIIYPGLSRSQSKASDWFKVGMEAATSDEKINAFQRAITLDPNYLEAYFYLGVAYKNKGQYQDAEVALNKAYFKNPFALSDEIKTRILFELGIVYLALGKTSSAQDALNGAKELAAQNASLRGRICYELGQLYIREGNFDLALSELKEGRALLPQNAALFDESISLADNKKSINDKYHLANSLLLSERYDAAIKEYNDILRLEPDFKDVADKLKQANDSLQKQNENKNLGLIYQRALELANEGSLDEAIALLEKIVASNADFRNANLELQRLTRLLQQRQTSDSLERLYNDGLQAMQQRNWRQALQAFEKVQTIAGNYKDVSQLIDRANQALTSQKPATASRTPEPQANSDSKNGVNIGLVDETTTDSLYQAGLFALQNGDWLQAISALEKVSALDPEFKDVQNKLADAQFNFNKNELAASQKKADPASFSSWMSISAFFIILFSLISGGLIFSPTIRARLYLMQGKYNQAALLYERILNKNPEKLKLYPQLANIYLLENRKDEKAIKVFELILKLNLFTQKKKEINSIVAGHYLAQNRTDIDAIKIMERELDSRINKNDRDSTCWN